MIEWEDKFCTKVSIIDEEHKKLIDIVNKVIIARQHSNNPKEISKILNEMMKYTHEHFKNEEAYMIKFNFPMYQYHKEEHLDFSIRTLSY